MPTIGTDCHITLTHPAVNGGLPYGFILSEQTRSRPEGIQVTREVFSEEVAFYDTGMRVWIHFDIMLADFLVNPNGSKHTQTRADSYAMLLQYLDQKDSINLESPIGTFVGLGALGYTAREKHFPTHSIVYCQLNNVGSYFPPVDPEILDQSIWDGSLTWATSYWR